MFQEDKDIVQGMIDAAIAKLKKELKVPEAEPTPVAAKPAAAKKATSSKPKGK